jgi:hypothetical protein
MQTRFQVAKKDIIKYFNDKGNRVYTPIEIYDILLANRAFWRLPVSLTSEEFAKQLTHLLN